MMGDAYGVLHHLETPEVPERRPRKPGNCKYFRQKWLENPIFSGWLAEVDGHPDKCYCQVCHVILSAGHSELERHAAGIKHCSLFQLKSDNKTSSIAVNDFAAAKKPKKSLILGMKPSDLSVKKTPKPSPDPNPARIQTHDELTIKRKSINDSSTSMSSNKKIKSEDDIPKKSSFPVQIDVSKLLKLPESDEESYDSEDSRYGEGELDVGIKTTQILNELQAEAETTRDNIRTQKPSLKSTMHDKELEARLAMIREKRSYNMNIYKLKLLEMETRLKMVEEERKSRNRLIEEERVRAEELHQLRTAQLQLQIQRENEFVHDDSMIPLVEVGSNEASSVEDGTPVSVC